MLDDPFSSQDVGRQEVTKQEVCRLCERAAQVVVLSHDARFLKRVWLGLPSIQRRALQSSEFGNVTITPWRPEEVQHEYVKLYNTLLGFCTRSRGDPEHVAKTIRPLLEGFLRLKLPDLFKENEWLGNYVADIRDADSSSPLAQAQGDFLDELTAVNDYSKRHHHFPGSDSAEAPVVSTELLAFGDRALQLVRGF